LPGIARDVLKLINRHLLQLGHWTDHKNAQRGAFDPAIEVLIEQQCYEDARKLAAEKLWSAHCASDSRSERMYRRYMFVVDNIRRAA
jgi:hypothetical protein